MPKSQGLMRFFAPAKKVPIKVGNKTMQFTSTQAVRLNELADRRRAANDDDAAHGIEQPRYALEDAAFRLLQTEEIVMAQAADCKFPVYVDASGLEGTWMARTADGDVLKSSVQTLERGYLALMAKDVQRLMQTGECDISILEFSLPPDPSAAELPNAVVTALGCWGDAKKVFRLQQPLRVDRAMIYLMAPLAGVTN